MKPINRKNNRQDEGTALIGVILALLVVTIIGIGITMLGMVNVTTGTNERQGSEAFYLADAGIAQGRRLVLARAGGNLDLLLQSGNGVACDGDELAAVPPPPLAAGDAIQSAAAGGQQFAPAGRFTVSVCDDNDGDGNLNSDDNDRIRLLSTGFGRDNSTATIEVLISAAPLPAIVVNGNMRMNGNPSVMGDAGAIHANGNLQLPGNPCAEEYFSSTGTISGDGQGGPGCTGGAADYRPGSDPVQVPDLQPVDFMGFANYHMDAQTCAVRNAPPPGGAVINNPADQKWGKWDCDPGARFWKFSGNGNEMANGTYYSTGSISISGSPGSPANPRQVTLVAQGYVDISGNPNLVPALTANGTTYSVIAGTDVRIGGNPGVPYSGVIYARDQIDFSGNPDLNAQVLAFNAADLPFPNPGGNNLVQLKAGGYMEISGNANITYNGGAGLVTVTMNGWRECRGPDPANPCN